MPIKILMPSLSPTMEDGTLAKWVKKEGDKVKSGDILAEIETDKATIEYESTEDGILAKIIVPDNTSGVAINQLIAVLLEEGESADGLEEFIKNNSESKAVESSSAPTKINTTQAPTEVKQEASSLTSENSIDNNSSIEDISYAGSSTRQITVRNALKEAIDEEMEKDSNVFLIGEEVGYYQGAYKISKGLLDKYGEQRIVDTPISEYGFTGLAVGAAFHGLRPIVEYMTFNFAMQAVDAIINSAAKTLYMSAGQCSVPIVFRGLNGGGSRVGAQHSQCYASWYAHCPGLIVIAPYSSEDAKGLLKSAIRNDSPVIFLEHEVLYGKSFDIPDVKDLLIPIGKAKIEKEGSDVTLISFSKGVLQCLLAAEQLASEGISAEVINLRTLRPLDIDTIVKSVQKTNRVVAVEEGWHYAGICSEIVATVNEYAFDYLDAPILRVTGKDVPMPYAANLEQLALGTVDEICTAVKKVCYK